MGLAATSNPGIQAIYLDGDPALLEYKLCGHQGLARAVILENKLSRYLGVAATSNPGIQTIKEPGLGNTSSPGIQLCIWAGTQQSWNTSYPGIWVGSTSNPGIQAI